MSREVLASWVDAEGKSWGSEYIEREGNKYRIVINAAYSDSQIIYIRKHIALQLAKAKDLTDAIRDYLESRVVI